MGFEETPQLNNEPAEKEEAEQEAIEGTKENVDADLEKLNFLDDENAINLVLTKENLKPVSILELQYRKDQGDVKSADEIQKEINLIKTLAKQYGLEAESKTDKMVIDGEEIMETVDIYVSKNKKDIEKLKNALDQKNHKETGRLLGFPKTAVEAFPETIDNSELPEEVKHSEELEFTRFSFSKDNWREEFETVKKWADTIKEQSPRLYKRATSLREKFEKIKKEDVNWTKNLTKEDLALIKVRNPELFSEIQEISPDESSLEKEKNERQEKELKLEEIRREVEETADMLGKGVDEGIKETVVMFMANGLPTSGSCEGHIEHALPTPYIDIEAPNEPETRFVGQEAIVEKVAKKYNVPVEYVKRAKVEKAWVEAIGKYSQNEETEEWKEWNKENEKLATKAKKILEEFYKNREVGSDIKLEIDELSGWSRIQSGKENNEKYEKELSVEEFTKERKQERAEKVEKYRGEMNEFTNFLKNKYFEK